VPLAAVLLLNVGGFHVKGSLVRFVSSALLVPWLLASLVLGGVRAGAQEGQIPIQHIVVLMQENRSFDSYFSALAGGIPSGTNPNPLGGAPISQFHKKTYCEVADLDHSWNGTHRQWNNGAMDGFTATNVVGADPTGSRTMGSTTRLARVTIISRPR
jgi:phospholipase C